MGTTAGAAAGHDAPGWTRLDQADGRRTLARLAEIPGAAPFPRDDTEVVWRSLPFYPNHRLYRLTNHATMPVFTATYLGDGVAFVALDGGASPIFAVNAEGALRLSEGTVVAYVDFFLRHVHGPAGPASLVEDPDELTAFESLSAAQGASLLASVRPPQVSRDVASATYKVHAPVRYGDSLFITTIRVAPNGDVAFEAATPWLVGMPPAPVGRRAAPRAAVESAAPRLDDLLAPDAALPPEEAMIAKALEILAHSAHGQRLVAFARDEGVTIGILATPAPVTYLPSTLRAYVGFNRKNPLSPARFVISLAAVLREAQQEASGVKHPPTSASREEQLDTSLKKWEDVVWHMCAVALELDAQEAFAPLRFRDALAAMGHAEVLDLFLAQEGP